MKAAVVSALLLAVVACAYVAGEGGSIKVTNKGNYKANCTVHYRLDRHHKREKALLVPGGNATLEIPEGATHIKAGAHLDNHEHEQLYALFEVLARKPFNICYEIGGTADYPQATKVKC